MTDLIVHPKRWLLPRYNLWDQMHPLIEPHRLVPMIAIMEHIDWDEAKMRNIILQSPYNYSRYYLSKVAEACEHLDIKMFHASHERKLITEFTKLIKNNKPEILVTYNPTWPVCS